MVLGQLRFESIDPTWEATRPIEVWADSYEVQVLHRRSASLLCVVVHYLLRASGTE
ncbi:hypothetical protein QA640_38600 [Bradyrhizobium sp. CB82]|uniref:hypothetical protein n=1 Tax=Bradyrhizobium sp. CB82 TaxID=3039159 RepID=UPI0024B15035|nr:hypothetical protein [Bradyrhizobium sp. CB82]WFU40072.1 hypothetical protein QA640_38600 [Bradyrhizobium sp. CB82]